METILTTSTVPRDAYARYLRAIGEAHLTLARELEALPPHEEASALRAVALGSLQQKVVDVLAKAEGDLTPREITRRLDRDDEPNVRTTLGALRKKGVAELATGNGPQRWRLAETYRQS